MSVFVRRCAARRAAIGSTARRNSMISSNSRSRRRSSAGAGRLRPHRDAAGRAALDLDQALALQHAHGLAHRRARHAELPRELALRRQAVAGTEVPEVDRTAQLGQDQLVGRDGCDRIERAGVRGRRHRGEDTCLTGYGSKVYSLAHDGRLRFPRRAS